MPLCLPRPLCSDSVRPAMAVARTWTRALALRCVLASGLSLSAGVVLADVYTEVNDKITSGQYAAAQTLIERQLQKQPQDPQIRLMQSQMQVAQGQTTQAIETLETLTQEFPELPEPYNNLAVLYAGQQRMDDALTALTKAVKARPDYALALENLGDVYMTLARQSYQKAQTLPAPDPLAGSRLARKMEQTGSVLQPAKP